MKGLTKNFRIATALLIVLIVVGMVFLGVFGFNKTIDYKNGYELKITLDANYGEDAEDNAAEMKTAAEKYFADNGVSYKTYAVEIFDDGNTLIYKFDKENAEKVIIVNLVTEIDTAIAASGLNAKADIYEKVVSANLQWGWIILALGISAVALFVYTLFMEKLSGAIAVIAVSVISAIVFIALMAITRIPAAPFIEATTVLTAIFGGIISFVLVNRCNELIKNVGNDKKSYAEIGNDAVKASLLRICFICSATVLAGILFIILGSGYLKFMGLQIILSVASSACVSVLFTTFIWNVLKKDKRSISVTGTDTKTSEPTDKTEN